MLLTKGTKARQEKIGLARSIVYTTHLSFWERIPISPVLGLSIQRVRARVKFWLSTDWANSFTQQILSVPNHFFWHAYDFYISAVPKIFYRVNRPLICPSFIQIGEMACITPAWPSRAGTQRWFSKLVFSTVKYQLNSYEIALAIVKTKFWRCARE